MGFLRGCFPDEFCGTCLALRLSGRPLQNWEVVIRLVDDGEVRLRTGTCQGCARTTEVFGQSSEGRFLEILSRSSGGRRRTLGGRGLSASTVPERPGGRQRRGFRLVIALTGAFSFGVVTYSLVKIGFS
jgi:hypothetical protein